ncbi:MAG TPA: polysaccharide biosynthesis C-terminal domain-containing protein, partial [Chitinophagaceae bacterium]|nr:polysaccharide biosynthesis C-terminal domain-containing protein [Chitinophagaceae bacterium]
MDATGRPHVNFMAMMGAAIFNVASNFVFIHYFGWLGAALGTLFSYFLLFVATQIILTRLIGVSQVSIVRNIFTLYPDYLRLFRSRFGKYFGYSYEK